MALPANDPYEEAAPVWGSVVPGQTIWGVTYQKKWTVSNMCAFADLYIKEHSTSYESRPDLMWSISYLAGGVAIKMADVSLHWANGVPYATFARWIKNPIWYRVTTPPNIILGIAHWHCGIPEASIDVTSFTTVNTFCASNAIIRSVAFVNESCLDIIQNMNEHSAGVYIYENGQQQLACGYFGNVATIGTPDWNLDESNINKVIRYMQIRDRLMPEKIKQYYNKSQVPVGQPRFGLHEFNNPQASYLDRELVKSGAYDGKTLDNSGASQTDIGSYILFKDWILLEVEVGGIGYAMDIDEKVEVDEAILGLSLDSTYKDIFRIHKVVLDPDRHTARITMVRKDTWIIT